MSTRDAHSAELQSLLDQAAAGEDAAYDRLVSRASARLLKLTRKMFRGFPQLRRWEQTDDVLQEAALRLHRSLSDVRPDSVRGFFGLAATQIRRTLIDLARHHYGPEGEARHHHSDADGTPGRTERVAATHVEPGSLSAWAEFHEAIEELPDEEREVFALTWYAGMSRGEVADVLEISVPTVKRRWQRAKLLIYERLQGASPTDDEQ